MATKKNSASWSDVKTRLADFDRASLLGLLQNLYAANKDNQTFLHARLSLGDDVLKPYKTIIDRWLWPDMFKNQDTSVAKAKKSIADYKKAIGQAEGMAELMVFYCERTAGFSNDVGLQDEGYFDALVRMFEQALKPSPVWPTRNASRYGAGWIPFAAPVTTSAMASATIWTTCLPSTGPMSERDQLAALRVENARLSYTTHHRNSKLP